MDAFYAAVEQRDHPAHKGRPVIVGGDPDKRGVVAACSYEARRFGIHSAMSAVRARKLCPHAVFIRPRFDVYRGVSQEIREIFREYTDLVEPLSLDEAFLDVTRNRRGTDSATHLAMEIRERIRKRTRLTASAGVSFNKFLAKVASDINKPDGITVVPPEAAGAFIDSLPIRKFFGVGKCTEQKMRRLGIRNGADLKAMDWRALVDHFGKAGLYFHKIAHGLDDRPVVRERIRKSIGKETTLSEDIDDRRRMVAILEEIAERLEEAMADRRLAGMTVTLKVKYFDFQSVTRSHTGHTPVASAEAILSRIRFLLDETAAGPKKVRLLGITLSNLIDLDRRGGPPLQLPLPFELPRSDGRTPSPTNS